MDPAERTRGTLLPRDDSAGGMPLTFPQENFLVFFVISDSTFYN